MSNAKYTEGSIRKHLMVMAGSATTGMMIMFLSDLVDMYFLGLLGEVEIAAAVGYAGSILFFTVSLNIGLSIACSALVSQAIGSGRTQDSRENVTHSCVSALLLTIPLTALLWWFIPVLLSYLGAEGKALTLATSYLSIIILSMPILALGMSASGVMRSQGDAKGALLLTTIGGVVNVILDPIFIFGFGLGVQGAAIATVLSRIAMVIYAYYVVVHKGKMLGAFSLQRYLQRFSDYMKIAVPAVLTNLSTPIGVAYVTYTMAQFGDSAVAGNAIISRIQPVAFAGLFALSGIVGPIAGQNFGAKKIDRVYTTLHESVRLVFIYCAVICFLLYLLQPVLVPLFNASEEANELVYLFCSGLSLMFIFNGLSFCTNALFNNLGVAHIATIMNLLKATLFTIPFVAVGAHYGEAKGALWGLLIGSAASGLLGLLIAIRFLKNLEVKNIEASKEKH